MSKQRTWMTPFLKQCFVTLGISTNVSSYGLVLAYSSVLLPQLRRPNSEIPIDDSSGSWIAAITGFALIAGNFTIPIIMSKLGRKTANLVSITLMLVSWFCIIFSNSIATLLAARFLQGVALGMGMSLGPVLIGEYTSPINRGAFLMTISLAVTSGVLTVHVLGSFASWQTTALICSFIAFVDLLIVIYSPESPIWLAEQGRYDESKRIFRWLRGDGEEDELRVLIETSILIREAKYEVNLTQPLAKRIRNGFGYFMETIVKKEFIKPIFIMVHIYIMGQWAGANILAAYATDIYSSVITGDINVHLLIITADIQRLISNTGAVYVIRKIRRRTMLFFTFVVNIFAFLATAAYTYAKSNNMLSFDHPFIGVALIHVHVFTIATGTTPLQFILSGEIFPLEYRSLAGGISSIFQSCNLFLTVKTLPLLLNTVGFHGSYLIYACIVAYCLLVVGISLPETKDRTLQDIEDEFRGKQLTPKDVKSTLSLTSWKYRDRRCSSPVIY